MSWPARLPLIAILRGIQPHEVLAHARCLVEAGFDAIEVPTHSPAWQDSVARLVDAFGDQLLIGGGTVLTPAQVDLLQQCGARLIVTPNTRPALIRHAVDSGLLVAAGFATASEAFDAIDAGAQALKLFPATTYGPGHVKALKAVLPALPLFAVGGIKPGNLGSFMAAGCIGAGLGGDLYQAGQDPEQTGRMARDFVQAYRAAAH